MTDNSSYCDFILSKFGDLDVTARRMFGGSVLHFQGRVLGFIFKNEFLFEPGPTAESLLPDAERKELFPGSKKFFVIDESMDPHRLCELAQACHDDLPVPKPRRARGRRGALLKKKEAEKKAGKEFPFTKFIKD